MVLSLFAQVFIRATNHANVELGRGEEKEKWHYVREKSPDDSLSSSSVATALLEIDGQGSRAPIETTQLIARNRVLVPYREEEEEEEGAFFKFSTRTPRPSTTRSIFKVLIQT